MSVYALRLQNDVDTAPRVRMGDTLHRWADGLPLKGRSGVKNDGGGAVTAVTGTMSVQVEPFAAWIDGDSSLLQGGYALVCDETVTLTVSDGPAAGGNRTDLVVARVFEDTYDGSGNTSAEISVVEGTVGQAAPAVPDSAVALAQVLVLQGMSAGTGGLSSSMLTDVRQFTASDGGVLRVSGTTERDALEDHQPGQTIYRTDTKALQVWNGTEWDTYTKASDTGWVSVSVTLSGAALAYRILDGVVFVRLGGSSTYGSDSNTGVAATGALPAAVCPDSSQSFLFAGAFIGGGVGVFGVGSAGNVIARQESGSTRTGATYGIISYPQAT